MSRQKILNTKQTFSIMCVTREKKIFKDYTAVKVKVEIMRQRRYISI